MVLDATGLGTDSLKRARGWIVDENARDEGA